MTIRELILEKRHAKFMVDFYKIHRLGSYRASATYQSWLKQYNNLKELSKKSKK
jgi:hypothetical protein